MGRIIFPRAELNGTLSDIVGYKAGLALNEQQLADSADEEYAGLILGDPEEIVTIRSEEAEDLVAQLLHGVGYTQVRRRIAYPGIEVMHRIKDVPGGRDVFVQFHEILNSEFDRWPDDGTPFDYTPVLLRAKAELGEMGAAIALMYLEALELSIQQNPWSQIRRIEWADAAQLNELFASESLTPTHGSYIDQRFIDYLAANFDRIDDMNWRKFEGLACEYFERSGYRVQIAEGRNDGGIDARVWRPDSPEGEPPLIVIQCKRQRKKIDKVILKALWTDVLHEGAGSGLIVTTSSLSPGAKEVATARSYNVEAADRAKVAQWIEELRTPYTGVFLGL